MFISYNLIIMYKTLTFDLGRDALRYLVRKYNIKTMHIPYYLCDVVRHTLFQEGCKPQFYHIDDNFFPAKVFSKEEFVLYPNYFGTFTSNVEKLVNMYPKLIVDNSHAYYDSPKGFACFNSGHKFGFKDSILYLSDINSKHYEINTLGKSERQYHFLELYEKYKDSNMLSLSISSESAPFVYPYLAGTIKDADILVKNLKEEGKTIYRYWNPLPRDFNEYKFYSRLVPIPVLP